MTPENRQKIQLLILSVAVLFFGLLAISIYNFLSSASVTINTSNPANVIKLEQITGSGKGKLYADQVLGHMHVRIKPGQYEISVYSSTGVFGTSQSINVKARQNLVFTLNPLAISSPELVYSDDASSVFANPSILQFVSTGNSTTSNGYSSGSILGINSSGITNLFPDYHNFVSAKWINSSLGIAQDNSNNLYLIKGGGLTQLKPPFNTDASTQLTADMGSDGSIYISDSKSVDTGSSSGTFRNVYTAGQLDHVGQVVAGKGGVAIIVHHTGSSGNQEAGDETNDTLIVVKADGTSVKKSVPVIAGVSWSLDGKYIVVGGSTSNTIYDSNLNHIKDIYLNGASNFTWLDDNSLLYSVGNQLWLYKVQSAQSTKLTTLDLKENITGIYISSDKAYVYFSDNNGEKTQLFRVGLNGQKSNSSSLSLSVFTPDILGSCTIGYLGYSLPTITVDYPADASQQNCQSLAQGELQNYGLNIHDFQYQFITQAIN